MKNVQLIFKHLVELAKCPQGPELIEAFTKLVFAIAAAFGTLVLLAYTLINYF